MIPQFEPYFGPSFPKGSEVAVTETDTLIRLSTGIIIESSIRAPYAVLVLRSLAPIDRKSPLETLQTEDPGVAHEFVIQMMAKHAPAGHHPEGA